MDIAIIQSVYQMVQWLANNTLKTQPLPLFFQGYSTAYIILWLDNKVKIEIEV